MASLTVFSTTGVPYSGTMHQRPSPLVEPIPPHTPGGAAVPDAGAGGAVSGAAHDPWAGAPVVGGSSGVPADQHLGGQTSHTPQGHYPTL